MSDDLIERLSGSCYLAFDDGTNDFSAAQEAIDRIEQLERENARLDAGWSDANFRALDAGLKLAEAVEALRDTAYFMERHSNRWDGVNGKHPAEVMEAARTTLAALEGK